MRCNHNIFRILLIVLCISITQQSPAQESELVEDMRRWLREQMTELDTITLIRPLPPQSFDRSAQIPLHLHRLPEAQLISPLSRLPSAYFSLPEADSPEQRLIRQMRSNLSAIDFSAPLPPIAPTRFVPERIGIRNAVATGGAIVSGDFCPGRALERRRHQRNQAVLERLGIIWRQVRWEIQDIDNLVERVNEVRFEEEKGL